MGIFQRLGQSAERKKEQPSKLRAALNRTRAFLAAAFATDPSGLVDEEYFEGVAESLVLADVGVELAEQLAASIRAGMAEQGLVRQADVPAVARRVIVELLETATSTPQALGSAQLAVVLLVGVNGSGKTTLAAKLAYRLVKAGHDVLVVAADTFRAAAVEQLKVWAERVGADVVAGQQGADPASVVYDAALAAQKRGVQVMLVDTAGRLQTKSNLMAELSKVARTIAKACPEAAIAHLLVLDATVGQNALSQAMLFNECCRLDGLAITKLDGSAKGGAVLAVVDKLQVPVLYLGVGEQPEDLLDFDARAFANNLVPD